MFPSHDRVVQLLGGSPLFFETFQTSAFTLRMPYGAIGSNDAQDGRIYYLKNSGTGAVTIETSGVGTTPSETISTLDPSESIIVFHGENDNWSEFETGSSGPADPKFLDLRDAAGGQSFTGGFVAFDWDIVDNTSGDYSFTPTDSEITFPSNEEVFIFYSITLDESAGSARSDWEARLELDTGSGFAADRDWETLFLSQLE